MAQEFGTTRDYPPWSKFIRAAARKKIIRIQEVRNRTGLTTSPLYEKMGQGTFPSSISLGGRARGWLEHEIDAWIEWRTAESRGIDAESPLAQRLEAWTLADRLGADDLKQAIAVAPEHHITELVKHLRKRTGEAS